MELTREEIEQVFELGREIERTSFIPGTTYEKVIDLRSGSKIGVRYQFATAFLHFGDDSE